jgi:hypothetical protein
VSAPEQKLSPLLGAVIPAAHFTSDETHALANLQRVLDTEIAEQAIAQVRIDATDSAVAQLFKSHDELTRAELAVPIYAAKSTATRAGMRATTTCTS